MQRDNVTAGPEGVPLELGNPQGQILLRAAAQSHHVHAKGLSHGCHSAPYTSHTHDTHALPLQFGERCIPIAEVGAVGPTALLDNLMGVMLHAVGDGEQHGKDTLRHRGCAIGRDIADDDLMPSGSLHVDNIISCGGDTYKSETRQLGEGFLRERNLVGEHYLSILASGDDHGGFCAGIYGELPHGGKGIPAEVAWVECMSV